MRIAQPCSLEKLIFRMIAADGPIPVDRYMSLCLGHPEHGFYMKGEPIGARGAFTTAPEISQMFGELIGAWCHAVWTSTGAPEKFHWVELGPGRGTLFADMVRVALRDPAFAKAARGVLIESSPILEQTQRTRLKDSHIPIAWVRTLDELPDDAPLIVVANEFFDALPIRQAIKGRRGWHERLLGESANELVLGVSPNLLSAELIPEPLRAAVEGSIVEFSPARDAAMITLAARLNAQGGAALIVDYGYEGPQTGETFQAMRAHGYANPLDAPGDADLTAHVDFKALAHASGGLAVFGPVAQGDFLNRLGIRERAARLHSAATPAQAADIAAALERLTDPLAMGGLFKALAICKVRMPPPPGFFT
jgi:NADH dehydrogenase [ubiquinone] 1 alpha subcomplex assembly factor 7